MRSGMQMIYENMTGDKIITADKKGNCRICGGSLPENPVFSPKHMSAYWTDEAVVSDPDSVYLCPACAWLTSKGKDKKDRKSLIWQGRPTMIVEDGGKSRHLEFYDFLNVLQNRDFTFPVLLAVHGKYQKATQKHIEWKSNRCVSYSPQRLRVAMSGMHIFDTGNGSLLDGVAQFNLDDWLSFVNRLCHFVAYELVPYMNPKFSDRTKAHFAIKSILDILLKSNNASEASYLAAYLAGYSAFPDLGKESAA